MHSVPSLPSEREDELIFRDCPVLQGLSFHLAPLAWGKSDRKLLSSSGAYEARRGSLRAERGLRSAAIWKWKGLLRLPLGNGQVVSAIDLSIYLSIHTHTHTQNKCSPNIQIGTIWRLQANFIYIWKKCFFFFFFFLSTKAWTRPTPWAIPPALFHPGWSLPPE
jgi:hypothetical protein